MRNKPKKNAPLRSLWVEDLYTLFDVDTVTENSPPPAPKNLQRLMQKDSRFLSDCHVYFMTSSKNLNIRSKIFPISADILNNF